VTIKVVYPEPDEVSFDSAAGCGMENDIYGITDPVWKRENNPDNPASYWLHGCIKIKPKFWASDDLTFVTPNVEIKPVGLGGEEFFTAYVTFGTLWPAPYEAVAHKSVSLLENSIGTTYLVIVYDYRVPWGTNQWLTMAQISGAHKIYRVWSSPHCGPLMVGITGKARSGVVVLEQHHMHQAVDLSKVHMTKSPTIGHTIGVMEPAKTTIAQEAAT